MSGCRAKQIKNCMAVKSLPPNQQRKKYRQLKKDYTRGKIEMPKT